MGFGLENTRKAMVSWMFLFLNTREMAEYFLEESRKNLQNPDDVSLL